MASSLHNLLSKIIKIGTLTVRGSGGEKRYGDGGGRSMTVSFTDAAAERELAGDPQLKFGELYMDGRLRIDEGDIYGFLALIKDNTLAEGLSLEIILRSIGRVTASRFRSWLPVA